MAAADFDYDVHPKDLTAKPDMVAERAAWQESQRRT